MKLTRIWVIGLAVMLAWVNLAASQERAGTRPSCRKASRPCGISSTSRAATNETAWTSTCPRRPRAGCRWSSGFTAAAWRGGSKEGCPAIPLVSQGLRCGQHQLPPQPARRLPGPDRGLQGGHPLAAGQRRQVPHRRRPHRRLGRLGRRPPGRLAGHHGRREGFGGQGREPRPVQPRAVRRRLVRPHGLDNDGRAMRQAGLADGPH